MAVSIIDGSRGPQQGSAEHGTTERGKACSCVPRSGTRNEERIFKNQPGTHFFHAGTRNVPLFHRSGFEILIYTLRGGYK